LETVLGALAAVLRVKRETLGFDEEMNRTAGWDSLATVNFIVALEEAFDHDIDLEASETMVSVRAAVEYFEAVQRRSRS
jgi:acyl carrier protein